MVVNQVPGQFNTAVYTWALNNLVWTPLFMALKGNKWSPHVEKSTVYNNYKVSEESGILNSKQFPVCKCNNWSKWSWNSNWSLSSRLAGFNTKMMMTPVSIKQHGSNSTGVVTAITYTEWYTGYPPTPSHSILSVYPPPPKKKKIIEAILISQKKKFI